MALLQNQFAMSTVVGTKVSGTNVITAEFYSATPTDTIVPGEMVVLSSTTNGLVPKVAKGTALTSLYFGVVLTSIVKESWAVGDRLEIALATSIVYMTAGAAITAGSKLQYTTATAKVATQVLTNSAIGIALDNATGDNVLIRVYVQPSWVDGGEVDTNSNAGTATDGEGLVLAKVAADTPIKRIKAGTGITVTSETSDVLLSTDGEANTVTNAGTATDGEGLALAKTGVNIPLKRIKAGTGITITAEANDIIIAVS